MKTIILIPAYNEEESIVRVVEKLRQSYNEYDYIVINDGSKDGTAKQCKKHNYHLLDLPVNLGLTGAIQAGMKYAYYNEYDYAIQYDGDGQHNPKYISEMIEKALNESLDIVIGSRYANKRKPFTPRTIGNTLIECCIFVTTRKKIRDSTSGMRLYNRKMIKKFATTMNYTPEPDTIAYLMRCGARVGEVQVEMNERMAGESYFNLSRIIKYMFHMCSSILVVQWFRNGGGV